MFGIKNILKIFQDEIGNLPWSGFSLVRRGAEHFSKHPGTIKQRSCRKVKKMTSALWSFFESGVQNFCGRIIQDNIGDPPWDYYFLQNLPESEYPKYLAKLFYLNTGEILPLRNGVIDKRRCKTFNQKIQWIKLYGVTDLMRDCTDKVKVRDYVKEKIGEEYLKPVLQIIPNESHETVCCHCEQVNDNLGLAWQSTDICQDTLDCRVAQIAAAPRNDGEPNAVSAYFDQIDFDKLPNRFVIKTNHGCKWQYIIKDKKEFLQNKQLFEFIKKNMTGWLEQDYCFWGGFELNYRGIKPKILIEPLMRNNFNKNAEEIHVFCFNAKPRFTVKIHDENVITVYDEELNYIDDYFSMGDIKVLQKADEIIHKTRDLSVKLSGAFKFVRVDWLIYQNKPYFSELTFTPNSGFNKYFNKKFNYKLGELINI